MLQAATHPDPDPKFCLFLLLDLAYITLTHQTISLHFKLFFSFAESAQSPLHLPDNG